MATDTVNPAAETAAPFLSQSGEGADTHNLPPAAEITDAIGEKTLGTNGASTGELESITPKTKPTQSFLACIYDPAVALWKNIIKPSLLAAIEWIRDHIFGSCCPATPKAIAQEQVEPEEGEKLTSYPGSESLQIFYRAEKERFEDITTCTEASVSIPRKGFKKGEKGTVSPGTGNGLTAMINYDRTYVGGEAPAVSEDAITARFDEIDVSAACLALANLYHSRTASVQNAINTVLAAAYRSTVEKDAAFDEEEFARSVTSNQETFRESLGAIRKGFTAYFHDQALAIQETRAARGDAAGSA